MHKVHYDPEYGFRKMMGYLKCNKIIDQAEYKRLCKFDKLRNKIIHRIVMHSYQPYPRNKVTKCEAIEGFEEGKALVKLMREKTTSF